MGLRFRLIGIVVLTCLLAPVAICISDASTAKKRTETFDIVWLRVKERYYDPSFNGVDWDAVKKQYAPLIATAKDDGEFYELLNRMLGELKQTHFAVIPPDEEEKASDATNVTNDSDIGITVQLVEDRPTVTKVGADSPAAKAGIRPGFLIAEIDEKPLSTLLEDLQKVKTRTLPLGTAFSYAVNSQLKGKTDSEVSITYLDEEDAKHRVTLKRSKLKGEPVKFGEMPTVFASTESRILESGIGYIRFNIFMLPLFQKIESGILSFADAPGIILDLRGNPGGIGGMAAPLAARFYSEQSTLGTMRLRQGEIRYVIFPYEKPYTGPVVILIDELSASTAEILAAGMQSTGRAKVVGQVSAGAALPSVIEKLPTGAKLQYAIADFKTPDGVMIEGHGTIPDVAVKLTRKELLAGHDQSLDQAIILILDQTKDSEQRGENQ